MARPSLDEKERRLDRLAGSGQGSGGGLPLPDLFSALLNEVLDSAPVTTGRMTQIASSVLSFKEQAVSATWPSWDALTADVLAQMESRRIISREADGWTSAPTSQPAGAWRLSRPGPARAANRTVSRYGPGPSASSEVPPTMPSGPLASSTRR